MKKIEEKVAISGDGAELIQKYLNELNMKLLAAGIVESYSIVMEAETLFISAINELNKTTKVTVYEVQKIIEKHGTPDEIVKRYKNAEEAELEDQFHAMDMSSKHLIKRKSNVKSEWENIDWEKLKNITLSGLGIILSILPLVLLLRVLAHLSLDEENFALYSDLSYIIGINNSQAGNFMVLSGFLFIAHEAYTSKTGTLFISLRNSIRARTAYRTIVTTGAMISVYLSILRGMKDLDLPYQENLMEYWIGLFFVTEITIIIRDHILLYYPLQPIFPPFTNYVRIPYLFLVCSIVLSIFALGGNNETLLVFSTITMFVAAITAVSKEYDLGPRFY
ncbi:MAG: hypothetical protein ACXAC2_10120, partial [Candidatus Kariarchaeaceae archaeon]